MAAIVSPSESNNATAYGLGAIAVLAAAVAVSQYNKKTVKVVKYEVDVEMQPKPTAKEHKKQMKATLKNIMMKDQAKTQLMWDY